MINCQEDKKMGDAANHVTVEWKKDEMLTHTHTLTQVHSLREDRMHG